MNDGVYHHHFHHLAFLSLVSVPLSDHTPPSLHGPLPSSGSFQPPVFCFLLCSSSQARTDCLSLSLSLCLSISTLWCAACLPCRPPRPSAGGSEEAVRVVSPLTCSPTPTPTTPPHPASKISVQFNPHRLVILIQIT